MVRALVSVSDKSGIADFAQALTQAGMDIISTGSTAATIAAAGVAVTPVEKITGFPESFDGRVKTLHPRSTAVSSPGVAQTRVRWPSWA